MKKIHVECKPDETLVKKLGFIGKNIIHHQGKSRLVYCLSKSNDELAVVDEDPGSVRHSYEKSLKFINEKHGIIQYVDNTGNRICTLKGKLEDWIVSICKQNRNELSSFGLPVKPNELHDIINLRLNNFERLLDDLLDSNNEAIIYLKNLLN